MQWNAQIEGPFGALYTGPRAKNGNKDGPLPTERGVGILGNLGPPACPLLKAWPRIAGSGLGYAKRFTP